MTSLYSCIVIWTVFAAVGKQGEVHVYSETDHKCSITTIKEF